MSDQKKWVTEAGPIQTKKAVKALAAIGTEANYRTEVTGVHDGRTAEEVVAAYTGRKADGSYDFSVSSYWTFGFGSEGADGGPAAQSAKAKGLAAAVGERFGWTITRANYAEVIAAAAEAVAALRATRPIIDKRDTPEEKAQTDAIMAESNAAQEARSARAKAATEAIRAKAPAGAALIVAEYREDTSWAQTDYAGHATVGRFAIGWRHGKREDFKQLRAAAEAFLAEPREVTVGTCSGGTDEHPCRHRGAAGYADQAPQYRGEGPHGILAVVRGDEYAAITEHRDNYSMGEGNYLSDHGWGKAGTGWVIRSVAGWHPEEYIDALPARKVGPTADPACHCGSVASSPVHHPAPQATHPFQRRDAAEGFAVRDSEQLAGYVEVTFPAKPDEAVRSELKSAGFRWALRSACWYGPASALPARYKEAA